MEEWNWAGNYRYNAARLHRPETVEQVQTLAGRCHKLRTLGTRHSFNGIADCAEDLVSLEHFNKVLGLDRERRAVTIEGGVRYGDLCGYLHLEGFALHNLASLPHISVAGACATATHGSGDNNGCLATAVAALEMVLADGTIKTLTREQDGEEFQGAIVGLGGLGVVTKLTLDIQPTFLVRQDVYENLTLEQVEAHFGTIMSSAYSVSLFTDWRRARFNHAWRKRRVEEGMVLQEEPEFFGASLALSTLHPIEEMSAENCTAQKGLPGPWHERLPHFRMEFTPSFGEELQSEYLLPRQNAPAALRAISEIGELIAPLLLISEMRTVAGDALWMSPFFQQPCMALHFTWKKDWSAVEKLLPRIEAALAPYQARPHWGKMFTMAPAQLQLLYPKLPDFQHLLKTFDPQGKFRNAFLDTYLFGAD
jgi:xylitol oxidase